MAAADTPEGTQAFLDAVALSTPQDTIEVVLAGDFEGADGSTRADIEAKFEHFFIADKLKKQLQGTPHIRSAWLTRTDDRRRMYRDTRTQLKNPEC